MTEKCVGIIFSAYNNKEEKLKKDGIYIFPASDHSSAKETKLMIKALRTKEIYLLNADSTLSEHVQDQKNNTLCNLQKSNLLTGNEKCDDYRLKSHIQEKLSLRAKLITDENCPPDGNAMKSQLSKRKSKLSGGKTFKANSKNSIDRRTDSLIKNMKRISVSDPENFNECASKDVYLKEVENSFLLDENARTGFSGSGGNIDNATNHDVSPSFPPSVSDIVLEESFSSTGTKRGPAKHYCERQLLTPVKENISPKVSSQMKDRVSENLMLNDSLVQGSSEEHSNGHGYFSLSSSYPPSVSNFVSSYASRSINKKSIMKSSKDRLGTGVPETIPSRSETASDHPSTERSRHDISSLPSGILSLSYPPSDSNIVSTSLNCKHQISNDIFSGSSEKSDISSETNLIVTKNHESYLNKLPFCNGAKNSFSLGTHLEVLNKENKNLERVSSPRISSIGNRNNNTSGKETPLNNHSIDSESYHDSSQSVLSESKSYSQNIENKQLTLVKICRDMHKNKPTFCPLEVIFECSVSNQLTEAVQIRTTAESVCDDQARPQSMVLTTTSSEYDGGELDSMEKPPKNENRLVIPESFTDSKEQSTVNKSFECNSSKGSLYLANRNYEMHRKEDNRMKSAHDLSEIVFKPSIIPRSNGNSFDKSKSTGPEDKDKTCMTSTRIVSNEVDGNFVGKVTESYSRMNLTTVLGGESNKVNLVEQRSIILSSDLEEEHFSTPNKINKEQISCSSSSNRLLNVSLFASDVPDKMVSDKSVSSSGKCVKPTTALPNKCDSGMDLSESVELHRNLLSQVTERSNEEKSSLFSNDLLHKTQRKTNTNPDCVELTFCNARSDLKTVQHDTSRPNGKMSESLPESSLNKIDEAGGSHPVALSDQTTILFTNREVSCEVHKYSEIPSRTLSLKDKTNVYEQSTIFNFQNDSCQEVLEKTLPNQHESDVKENDSSNFPIENMGESNQNRSGSTTYQKYSLNQNNGLATDLKEITSLLISDVPVENESFPNNQSTKRKNKRQRKRRKNKPELSEQEKLHQKFTTLPLLRSQWPPKNTQL